MRERKRETETRKEAPQSRESPGEIVVENTGVKSDSNPDAAADRLWNSCR